MYLFREFRETDAVVDVPGLRYTLLGPVLGAPPLVVFPADGAAGEQRGHALGGLGLGPGARVEIRLFRVRAEEEEHTAPAGYSLGEAGGREVQLPPFQENS